MPVLEIMLRKIFVSVGECMAELQSADAGLYSLGFGGDTFNTAWYVRALTQVENLDVEYLTVSFETFLEKHFIGRRFVQRIPDRNMGLYLISLKNAERSFTYWRNASAARLLANDINHITNVLQQANVIYFSGVTLAILDEPHRQNFLAALQNMKDLGKMIVFDSNARPKLWNSPATMKVATVAGYRVATVALPTFDDDRQLFGDETPAASAERIASYGVAEVIVKNGDKPSLVSVHGHLTSVSPNSVEHIIDTTGAGDSFNAGYIAARSNRHAPTEAAKFAHLVAARVIGGRGALIDMKNFSDLQFR
jgi:2-dehydro-3-deoxygluconokinase